MSTKISTLVASRFANRVALNVGETMETEKWRIHRFAESIRVTDLTNAGKRGKKVESWIIFSNSGGSKALPLETMALQYAMWAKRDATPAKMKSVLDEDLEVYGDTMSLETRTERGVDVLPGGFKPVFVRGAHVTIESSLTDFVIRDINDDNNEPTCIAKGKKSIGQFYKWISENQKKAQSMTLGQIMNALKTEGIEYHYFCAVD